MARSTPFSLTSPLGLLLLAGGAYVGYKLYTSLTAQVAAASASVVQAAGAATQASVAAQLGIQQTSQQATQSLQQATQTVIDTGASAQGVLDPIASAEAGIASALDPSTWFQ